MANWQRTLDLTPEFRQAREGDVPIQKLANIVADRLAQLAPFQDERLNEEKEDIVDEFRDLAVDDSLSAEHFDPVFERLYDWADTSLDGRWNGKKVCWVKTT